MTDRKPKPPAAMRPHYDARLDVRETREFVDEFKATAKAIDRKPSDCMREAVRDWTARQRAIYGLAMLFLLLLPGLAFAGPFDPGPNDLSKNLFLDGLFGELTGDGGASPLGAPVGAFNAAVLIVAGILVFYTMVAGTLSTAADGELLGRKWSSVWVPVRTTLGAAAIMPSIGSGFSVIQAVVIWLALQGVGLANTVWEGFAAEPMAGAAYVPPSEVRQLELLAADMFRLHVCRAAIADYARIVDWDQAASAGLRNLEVSREMLDTKNWWGWELNGLGTACGVVKVSKPSKSDFPKSDSTPATARALVDPHALSMAMFPVHQGAMQAMDARMGVLAEQFVRSPGNTNEAPNAALVVPGIQAAAQEYAATIRAAAEQHSKALTSGDFKEALTADGWIMAGAFYTKLAHAMDAVSAAVSRTATVEVEGLMPVPHAQLLWAEASVAASAVQSPGAHTVGSVRDGGLMDKLLNWVLEAGRGVDPDGMSGHPLVATKNTGEMMKTWGIGIYAVGTVGVAAVGVLAGNIAGKAAGADTALLAVTELISGPVFAVAGPLTLMGAVLSGVVPMLPYILWIGVVLGWMVLVVEAVIAAPLWAVAHMAPDGDGVVGRGGQGYMLVLSLTLRPALMVLGLCCAIALLIPIGELLNSSFAHVFRMSVMQDNASWGGLINVIMGLLIYTTLMVTLVTKVFGLIHVVPDSVLRWIGGGVDNMLGQQANALSGAVEGKSTALVAGLAGTSMASASIGRATASMAQQVGVSRGRAEEERSRQDSAAVQELDQSRDRALQAEERAEPGTSPAAEERAAHAQTHRGHAALAMAARMDKGFAERLAEARNQDQGTGGTAAQDALLKSEASTALDAPPYQHALAEAKHAFGRAELHLARKAKLEQDAEGGEG